MKVVGNYFISCSHPKTTEPVVWLCTSYDPNCGYWMEAPDGYKTNVSERAIQRTFHLCHKNGKPKHNSYE